MIALWAKREPASILLEAGSPQLVCVWLLAQRHFHLYHVTNENAEFRIDPSFEPTNSPSVTHEVIQPYANSCNTKIFSDLQKLEGIGLVVPVGEDHMYFAAMNSKSCALTSIGKQYWRLVNSHLI